MKDKILLVDDEQDFIDLLSERLESRDIDVEKSTTGEKAVDKVKDENYDAVVLDLKMPGMDGIEALKKIMEINPEMQIIILTGHATVDKGVKAMKLGALDFIEKPVKMDELLEKINKAKANKMLITEKRLSNKLKDILSKKSW